MMAGILFGGEKSVAAPVPLPEVARNRIAVVYFSWSSDGNTRFAAETIARRADARLFEIKAEKPYSTDFQACCDEAKSECYGKQLRPIRPVEGFDVTQYDAVFIGTPNWWGTMAPPVRTFVAQNAAALKDKIVCLFQTNGGGGMQRCEIEFAELLPQSNVLKAQEFAGSSIRHNVTALENFVTDRVQLK